MLRNFISEVAEKLKWNSNILFGLRFSAFFLDTTTFCYTDAQI